MATQLLLDETGFGVRLRTLPPASYALGAVPQPSTSGVGQQAGQQDDT